MEKPGRILGIDYGEKRVGLAITDPLAITARGFETIFNRNRNELLKSLQSIISSNEIKKIIVGIPYSLDGNKGPMAEVVEEFTRDLSSATEVMVDTWSEEFSSEDAKTALRELGVDYRRNKGEIDKMAAALILRSYLDNHAG